KDRAIGTGATGNRHAGNPRDGSAPASTPPTVARPSGRTENRKRVPHPLFRSASSQTHRSTPPGGALLARLHCAGSGDRIQVKVLRSVSRRVGTVSKPPSGGNARLPPPPPTAPVIRSC